MLWMPVNMHASIPTSRRQQLLLRLILNNAFKLVPPHINQLLLLVNNKVVQV
jgi:hypothetical protein